MSSSPSIHQRLLNIENELLGLISGESPGAVLAFEQKWAELSDDIETATQAGVLDEETRALTYNVASKIAISVDLINQRDGALHGLDLPAAGNEDLHASSESDSDSAPVPPSAPVLPAPSVRPDPTLPPYIEPAYRWLLKHLYNPYPKKEIKEKIADQTGSSIERISDWFVDVRRRMGWTTLLREEFGRKRNDLVDAATRFYHPNRKSLLPPDIHSRFVQMEAFAHDMYAAKFVPSALSNKLTAAVKDLTPERQEQARLQRLQKAEAQKEAARLGVYPSPPASGASSPISDPGASTSSAGHKRSRSEVSSDDEDSRSKRPRTDDASTLPSPPHSASSSPTGRKRRLSDADAAPYAKRPRPNGNRSASDPIPVTITLSETPDLLADWFTSNGPGQTNIFEPGQLLDIKFFDPNEYDFGVEEAAAPAQPVVQTTAPTPEPAFDLENLVNPLYLTSNVFIPQQPAQADPYDLYANAGVYEPQPQPQLYNQPFMEPYSGNGFDGFGFINEHGAIDGVDTFGFDHHQHQPLPAFDNTPLDDFSVLPGADSMHAIQGFLQQQPAIYDNNIQNQYMYQTPIGY